MIAGSPSQSGVLHIIESGFAIVHDHVTLQKRAERRAESRQSPSRVSIDTRLVSLGPGALLFTESQGDKASARATQHTGAARGRSSTEREEECTLADSPVVHTFSVQLFPHKHLNHVNQASSHSSELFASAVLGRGGLQAVQQRIREHRAWRTSNTVYTSRTLEASLPRESPAISTVKQRLVLTPNASVAESPMQLDLTRFLKDRQLHGPESQPLLVPGRPSPTPHTNQWSPRALIQSGSSLVSPKPHVPMGSFAAQQTRGVSVSSPRSNEPSSSLPQLTASPPLASKESGAPSTRSLKEQLRKEELVLQALSSPPTAKRGPHESEKQLRRRHGRPPPRRIENRGLFIDEHAFTAVTTLQQQHDRKKSGLCRRLLHLK